MDMSSASRWRLVVLELDNDCLAHLERPGLPIRACCQVQEPAVRSAGTPARYKRCPPSSGLRARCRSARALGSCQQAGGRRALAAPAMASLGRLSPPEWPPSASPGRAAAIFATAPGAGLIRSGSSSLVTASPARDGPRLHRSSASRLVRLSLSVSLSLSLPPSLSLSSPSPSLSSPSLHCLGFSLSSAPSPARLSRLGLAVCCCRAAFSLFALLCFALRLLLTCLPSTATCCLSPVLHRCLAPAAACVVLSAISTRLTRHLAPSGLSASLSARRLALHLLCNLSPAQLRPLEPSIYRHPSVSARRGLISTECSHLISAFLLPARATCFSAISPISSRLGSPSVDMSHNITSDGSPTPRKTGPCLAPEDFRLEPSSEALGAAVGSYAASFHGYPPFLRPRHALTSMLQGAKRPTPSFQDASSRPAHRFQQGAERQSTLQAPKASFKVGGSHHSPCTDPSSPRSRQATVRRTWPPRPCPSSWPA